MKILQLSNINYSINSKNILSDINLSVEEGEFFALLGENGSGKSTLLDIMLGDLNYQKGGSIKIFEGLPKRTIRGKIGIVYEHLPLFPMLRVIEIIKYFSTMYKCNFKNICKNYFTIFNIEKIKHSLIRELSTGEKKRVALLLAIIHKPDLLVLDEPFSNIDPTLISVIWNALKENTKTIFYTSHNWLAVEKRASKVCFLFKGKILTLPTSPEKLLGMLPHKKKIELEATKEHIKIFNTTEHYIHDNTLHVFYNEKSDLLNKINTLTNNYSIKSVDLKDAYLFCVKSLS